MQISVLASRPILLLAWLLLTPAPAWARTWTDLDHPVSGPPADAARAFVAGHASGLGLPVGALRVARVIALRGGTVVRLVQDHLRRPVVDAELSVLILGGRIVAISGELQPLPRGGTAAGVLSAPQAEQTLRRAIPGAWSRRSELAFRASGGEALPVWVLDVEASRPWGLWRVQLDARSGQVLQSTSRVVRSWGNVFATIPTSASSPTTKIELLGLKQKDALVGEHADVSSCGYSAGKLECQRLATPDAAGDYLFQPSEPSTTDPFAEVQAYHHVDLIHRWLAKRFGFARPKSQQIKVVANFHGQTAAGNTQGVYNAFFGDMDGDGLGELVFGQGQRDFAYDAGVVYHEFTHSVVAETSDLAPTIDELGFNAMPSALNEAFADLISAALTGQSLVGGYAGGSAGFRSLAGKTGCPSSLPGEEHEDGLIWGQANWAVRSKLASPDAYDDVIYKTMVSLGAHATIAEAAALLLKIAALSPDPSLAPAAKAELTARGVDVCTRIVRLRANVNAGGLMFGLGTLPGMSVVPGPLQYEIVVPPNATALKIATSGGGGHMGSGKSTSVGAFVRKGTTVAFAVKSTYDFVQTNGTPSITLEVGSAKTPLEPGATYYVLPVNVGSPDVYYQLSYSITAAPAPDAALPDAAPPARDAAPPLAADSSRPLAPAGGLEQTPRGCSCQSAAAAPPTPLVVVGLLGLGALLVVRGRRRQRAR